MVDFLLFFPGVLSLFVYTFSWMLLVGGFVFADICYKSCIIFFVLFLCCWKANVAVVDVFHMFLLSLFLYGCFFLVVFLYSLVFFLFILYKVVFSTFCVLTVFLLVVFLRLFIFLFHIPFYFSLILLRGFSFDPLFWKNVCWCFCSFCFFLMRLFIWSVL